MSPIEEVARIISGNLKTDPHYYDDPNGPISVYEGGNHRYIPSDMAGPLVSMETKHSVYGPEYTYKFANEYGVIVRQGALGHEAVIEMTVTLRGVPIKNATFTTAEDAIAFARDVADYWKNEPENFGQQTGVRV